MRNKFGIACTASSSNTACKQRVMNVIYHGSGCEASFGLLPEPYCVKVSESFFRLWIITRVLITLHIAFDRGVCILFLLSISEIVPFDGSGILKLCFGIFGAFFWMPSKDWLLLLTAIGVNFRDTRPSSFVLAGLLSSFSNFRTTCRQLAEVTLCAGTCLHQGVALLMLLLHLPVAPLKSFLDRQRLNPQESIVHHFPFLSPCGLPKTWLHTFLRPY